MSRREFPDKVKAQRFRHCGGHCEGTLATGERCGIKLTTGKFHYDHDKTDNEGGEPVFNNCRVLCIPCHLTKTKTDVGRMAKTERMFRRNIGIRTRKGRPMPGGRDSPFKKKMDGSVVRR